MTTKLENKIKHNIWDSLDDVLPIIARALQDKVGRKASGEYWTWVRNPKCKYIDLRIDMRDGGCLLTNRDGQRINPEDLAYQYGREEK